MFQSNVHRIPTQMIITITMNDYGFLNQEMFYEKDLDFQQDIRVQALVEQITKTFLLGYIITHSYMLIASRCKFRKENHLFGVFITFYV